VSEAVECRIVRTTLRVIYFVGLSLLSCSEPDNVLEGSISQHYSLEFEMVRITKQACLLRIDYLRRWPGGGEDPKYSTCRIDVPTQDISLHEGEKVSGGQFVDEITVARVLPTPRGFPEMTSGWIELEEYELAAGEPIKGRFGAEFDFDGKSLDIKGTFEGDLEESKPIECE
jgi:hypothetical protein